MPPLTFLGLFMLPFVAVGIGTLLYALSLGLRHGELLLSAEGLRVRRQGLFGTRIDEVPLADIRSVVAAPSGNVHHGTPILNLLISRHEGPSLGLFANLQPDEVAWLAGLIERTRARLAGA